MKTVTLVAIIAMALDTVASLYWQLVDFRALEYNELLARLIRPLYLLSNIGLLVFFIYLYQKQSKN
jgi:hypothetical protein